MKLPQNTALGRQLVMVEVLDYYDFPRLFLSRNDAGHLYLAIWQDDAPGGDVWLYAASSLFRARRLCDGMMDIRDAFLSAEDGQVLRVTTGPETVVVTVPCGELNADELPPEGDRLRVAKLIPNNRPASNKRPVAPGVWTLDAKTQRVG